MKAVQKWETSDLILQGENKKVRYNIKSHHKKVVRDETSTSESLESKSSDQETSETFEESIS